jgi:N-methylhydantoinase B
VVRDVVWRKVSREAALAAYGVVLTGSLDDDDLGFDADATTSHRAGLDRLDHREGELDGRVFFDRGPGYARLSGGAAHAEVDLRG